MLDCKQIYDALAAHGITFYAGVPDSLLKDFCAYVTDHTDPRENIIAANEGSALGLAAGYHLATGRPGVVYMQNSGFGNIVNPLTSLADEDVYAIPMLLIVGWRGEPGVKDEPQHVKMGRIMAPMVESLGLRHAVLPDEPEAALAAIELAVRTMRETSAPYALLVKKNTFAKYKLQKGRTAPYTMTREEAIARVAEALGQDVHIVATTGMPSRELFEYRAKNGLPHDTDFLTVGSMGHASQLALGIALQRPDRQVVCLDGDGALLMHMGGLASIGALGPKNFKHVVVNNGAHDSVGGQPTVAFEVDFGAIARASGYKDAMRADSPEQLAELLPRFQAAEGPVLLEVRVKTGARDDLGRPTRTPRQGKEDFMAKLQDA